MTPVALPENYRRAIAAMRDLDTVTRRMCKRPIPQTTAEIEAELEVWRMVLAGHGEVLGHCNRIKARAILACGALLREVQP